MESKSYSSLFSPNYKVLPTTVWHHILSFVDPGREEFLLDEIFDCSRDDSYLKLPRPIKELAKTPSRTTKQGSVSPDERYLDLEVSHPKKVTKQGRNKRRTNKKKRSLRLDRKSTINQHLYSKQFEANDEARWEEKCEKMRILEKVGLEREAAGEEYECGKYYPCPGCLKCYW